MFFCLAICVASLEKIFPKFGGFFNLTFPRFIATCSQIFYSTNMLFPLALCVAELASLKKMFPGFRGFVQLYFYQISCYWFADSVPLFCSYKVRFSRLSARVTLAIYNVVIVQTVKNYTVINNAMPKQSILMTLHASRKIFL
jgi:hypothetical protein